MNIYVVQPGDTIFSIAGMYGVTAYQLIQDNALENPYELVPGQTIVISYPKQTHTVIEGDSIESILNTYQITFMQLLRNNPFLSERNFLYLGETLIISYNTIGSLSTMGYIFPFINMNTLRKTLPNLTYLSVLNYRTSEEGEIITSSDDTEIVQTAKDYGVVPLMMITTLTEQGEPNIEIEFSILLSKEYQNQNIDKTLNILKTKGYQGVNIIFNYINTTNYYLYEEFIANVASRLNGEGYMIFVTINPHIDNINGEISFEKVDYSGISQHVNAMVFLRFIWGKNFGPPKPVSSITNLKAFIDYVLTTVEPEKIILGKPIISLNWELPFIQGSSNSNALTLNATISLANDVNTTIQFDEISYTPYFYYYDYNFGIPIQHIVWSIDARSINILNRLVSDHGIYGTGVWNIMVYYRQLWLIINSQYDIIKLLPDNQNTDFLLV